MRQLVNASMLNQYLYCPRRFWYIIFYNTQGKNYYRTDGKIKHKNQSKRGGWTKEIYLESEGLGLKGKVDILEDKNAIPVERKRGDRHYQNDEIQLSAYCMLLEDNIDETVDEGVIYLFGTDERHKLTITDWHRERVLEISEKIKSMDSNSPPPFTDNPNKCVKCSTRGYCMPEESRMLGEA